MAGYSGKTLVKKLGFMPGDRVYIAHAPANYRCLVEPLPEGVTMALRLAGQFQLVHLFIREARELTPQMERSQLHLAPNGMIWVSWPKKAARVPTDVTEDIIRATALPLGLVDIKVCAVDATWSGLKLVRRRDNRKP